MFVKYGVIGFVQQPRFGIASSVETFKMRFLAIKSLK